MNKIVKFKFFLLAIYGLFSMFFFYDEHFIQNSIFLLHPHQYENLAFMLSIFSLGVIFSAMVYNLAFYFYIRHHQYLYYALTQFCVLLTLFSLESLQISPFTEIYTFKSIYLLDVSQTCILIFSLLFIQDFFKTKEFKDLNRTIKIVLFLALFDIVISLFLGHTLLTKFIPNVIWIWFILTEIFRVIKKRDITFYIVMLGWHSVIIILVLELLYIIDPKEIDFPFLHLAFVLESILLSFALSYKFKLIDEAQKVQQSLLLQQSRLASMGEMISIIAHQWRQPLNFLSYSLIHIKLSCKEKDELSQTILDANEQLQYMSKTIENFRNFYNPSKEKKMFSVEVSCNNVLHLLLGSLNALKIEILLTIKDDFSLFGNSNEFEQALLNIINNSKDILEERAVINSYIHIEASNNRISITDNGGGIEEAYQNKIFEPYFTSKEQSDGIGLYIAKTIVEQELKGKLYFENTSDGCQFIFEF